jgi:hypothetical protein
MIDVHRHRRLGIAAVCIAAVAFGLTFLPSGVATANAQTTCTWGGTPANPTGTFTIRPGLTNSPVPGALKFRATGTLGGTDPICTDRVRFVGQLDAGSTCALASFEGTVEGLPGVARFWGKGSLDVPSFLYDREGNLVGVENAQIVTEENLANSLQCGTPEGFTGPAGFSSNIVLF